jgi:hypothetical protein
VLAKILSYLLTASILTFGSTSSAYANWFEKGADVLKGIQGSDNNGQNNRPGLNSELGTDEIQQAFKQALSQGTETIVNQLGAKDGFNADPQIHIPLPKSLKKVQSTLDQFGMGDYMSDLETKLNRAAEAATPQAKALFINAIKDMSFEDIQKIYKGPKDSATQYLKEKTSPQLKQQMAPIIDNTLNEVGALKAYDKAIKKYKDLPFVPNVKADLQQHVIDEGLDGMFHYIAKEEAAIRENPVKQTTNLLKKVFGN